jgi:DNA replication and repair protein RecF
VESILCSYSRRGGKTLKRNGKEYDKLSDHVGHIPIVIVSPADTALISDSAEERRKYLNRFISQIDRTYLAALMRYNAALQERNKLLKTSPTEDILLIYDAMLTASAEVIFKKRSETIEALIPLVAEFYAALSEQREVTTLEYRSELHSASLADLLLASRQKDFVNEHTTSGIHRDDVIFSIGEHPLRKFGSQGQQKSFLLALKLTQYALLRERLGEKPILLLDDLFDKLDEERLASLLVTLTSQDFGQVFITDCNRERIITLLKQSGCEFRLFSVGEGVVQREEV